jgi:hypothetical protein
MKERREYLLVVSTLTCLCLVFAASAGAQTFEGAVFYGGSGDQRGLDIAIIGDDLYVVGTDSIPGSGFLVRYDTSPTSPTWSYALPWRSGYHGVAATPSTAYPAGSAYPTYCGASDGVGGTEPKSSLARHNSADGTHLGCRSQNFFPYRGYEWYDTVLVVEDGSVAVYAAGWGEERGWGAYRTILAKYESNGTLLWKRNYATDLSGHPIAGYSTRIHSRTYGLAWLNGYLYVAGHDRGADFIGGPPAKPMLLKYDAAAELPDPNPNADGAGVLVPVWARVPGLLGEFMDVTAFNGYLYAAGHTYLPGVSGSSEYILHKYDQDGTLEWSSVFGGTNDDRLEGVISVGNQLFVVGSTHSQGAGGSDIVVMEIDPLTGATLSTTLFGGPQDDMARGVATDGIDLYVVGESRSFTEGGNGVGENDLVLLRYSITPPNQPPVANAGPDQTVECTSHTGASVTLDRLQRPRQRPAYI